MEFDANSTDVQENPSSQLEMPLSTLPPMFPQNKESTPEVPAEQMSENTSPEFKDVEEEDETEEIAPPTDQPPQFNEEDIQHSLDRFVKNGELPPEDERLAVFQLIERKWFDCVSVKNYIEAQQLKLLSHKYQRACIDDQKELGTTKDVDEQIKETNYLQSETESKWKETLKELIQTRKDKREKLAEKHAEELAAFDEKHSEEQALREFAKPSKRLLQARYREQSFILIGDFGKARKTKAEVAAIEEYETSQAQMRAETEILARRQQLINKQNREMGALDNQTDQTIQETEKKRDEQIFIIQQRIRKLQHQKAQIPSTTKRLNSRSPLFVASPRTQKRITNYKKRPAISRLVMEPIILPSPNKLTRR